MRIETLLLGIHGLLDEWNFSVKLRRVVFGIIVNLNERWEGWNDWLWTLIICVFINGSDSSSTIHVWPGEAEKLARIRLIFPTNLDLYTPPIFEALSRIRVLSEECGPSLDRFEALRRFHPPNPSRRLQPLKTWETESLHPWRMIYIQPQLDVSVLTSWTCLEHA